MPAKAKADLMKRTCRVFLNELNPSKTLVVTQFLYQCHNVMQYFVDLFWQRQDFSSKLADLPTVHTAVNRFGITTRLSQALAKQAKEVVRSQRKKSKSKQRKPRLRWHTVTLFYHFVTIERFNGKEFDWAVKLIGSGAPQLTIPVRSTKPLNQRLADGWQMAKTLRTGLKNGRLFVEFILEKARPNFKQSGRVVGMDSNYKAGLVFSDGQVIGEEIYQRIQGFCNRQKHTHAEVKSMVGHALKKLQFSDIKSLCIEDLKRVKSGKRGTFSRRHNRRLSHWLYASVVSLLSRKCEELGIQLERKDPFKTSQFCSNCNKWDRRNRKADRFCCVHCGYLTHADTRVLREAELHRKLAPQCCTQLGAFRCGGSLWSPFLLEVRAMFEKAKFWLTITAMLGIKSWTVNARLSTTFVQVPVEVINLQRGY